MKFSREVRFALGIILCAAFLHLFPYDEQKVANIRFENAIQSDRAFKDLVAAHCSSLRSVQDGLTDRMVVDAVMSSKAAIDDRPCQSAVETGHTHRFFLRSSWVYSARIQNIQAGPAIEKTFHIEFPRPLCLLPLAGFVLALISGFHAFRFIWLFPIYLFFLGGGNLIRTLELCFKSAVTTARSDQTFLGLALILLWLAIQRSGREERKPAQTEQNATEAVGNRLLSTLIGLWSPAFYTLLGKLQFPFRAELSRLQGFLRSQIFVCCLSVYLLSLDFSQFGASLVRNLTLPRYLSFAILLFSLASNWSAKPRRTVVIWNLPHFWRSVIFVATVEVISHYVLFLGELNTLTRVGLALVFSELLPNNVSFVKLTKNYLPWFGVLFLTAFVPIVNAESGLTDVALVLWDPKAHPNSLVLFTFLSALCMGFLTGSFSATFFALLTVLSRSVEQPLVRAAALDGILAGSLLSPFSVFNLLPAVQFGINPQDLVADRLKKLGFPLLVGVSIYAVSSLESLAILRPLTFVFLCLVALAFQLQRNDWVLERTSFFFRRPASTAPAKG